MTIHELKLKFLQIRDYLTDDVNELLDFTKKSYVHNEISICEYRSLVRELEKLGAKIPDIFIDNSLIN
ncbi:YppF family protein [Bacillus sp. V3B]|uniref:YppF family protein n=1 Tax=Bacillus sp. V3B TaxID=2804915 RepID=UPI0021098830|nr:YppF family protein [Bacillus sp. V3B]MCQ6273919.1 YppF family protein [Bacillus sp. V3B]